MSQDDAPRASVKRELLVSTAVLFRWARPFPGSDPIPFPFPIHNLALLGIRNTLFVFAGVGVWWLALSAGRLVEILG